MSDRIDPSNAPTPRGPWPEATDPDRLYDHGQAWCVNAAAHPDRNGGYPDRDRHLPWHECRSLESYVDGARLGLDGQAVGVSAYAAAGFRFGRTRDHAGLSQPRAVLETWPLESTEAAQRISLTPAGALHLARILVHIADGLTFTERAT